MSNSQGKSMDHLKLRYVVTEEHNAPALLKKYNKLRRVAYHTKKYILEYKVSKAQVEMDLPRTFTESKFLSDVQNQDKIREIMFVFHTYSNIGYLQGMLFILVPLLFLFEKKYTTFWSFVDITELLRPFYLRLIVNKWSEKPLSMVSEVMTLWKHCSNNKKISENTEEMIRFVVQHKMMSTLFFSILGKNLESACLLLEYFLIDVQRKNMFYCKLKAFAFAVLLSILPHDNQCEVEDVELLSTCYLSDQAVESLLRTASHSEFFFENGST